MKHSHRWRLAAAGLVAITALGACSSTSSPVETPVTSDVTTAAGDDEKVVVAFLVKSLAVDFWKTVAANAEATAAELGNVELIVHAPDSEANVDQQVNQVESMVAQGVDAIVIAPVAPVQLEPPLSRAVDAGIPVVVLDSRVENFEDKQSAYVGTDNFNGGKAAGEFIAEELGGQGKVALVNGTPGVSAVEDRIAGVTDALAGTGVEIVGQTAAVDCTTDNGVRAAEDLLSAHPDLDGMFVACGTAAVGANRAVEASPIKWEDFVLVGFDAAPEELASVAAGQQRATIAQDQMAMASESLRAAVKAALGEAIENTNVDPGVKVVTAENVSELLD